MKLVSLAQKMKDHPDYLEKFAVNTDVQNKDIAFNKIFEDVMSRERKNELDLYRLLAKDDAFKLAMQDTLKRVLRA
jgi:type I restriction enzyme R subunit